MKKQSLKECWEDIDELLYWESLSYIFEVIWTKLISKHHNNPLVGYFGIKKIWKLIAWKYYLSMLRANIESYIKGYNMYLISKLIRDKPYGN